VANQYDQYEAAPGQKLNGKLTLGENIADIGGLKLALSAYHAKHPNAAPMLGGLTGDQQFYVAFAQSWCANIRPEAARLQAQTNEHSTPQWRVNGSVSDTPDFARAFACPAGSPMAPKDRCTVW
jgi:predicted metalloendopeptidase